MVNNTIFLILFRNKYLSAITESISIIPLIIGFYHVRRFNKAFLFLLIMVMAETGVAFYSGYQARMGVNNIPSLHFMTIAEIATGSAFFYLTIHRKVFKQFILWSTIALLLFAFYYSLFYKSIYTYNHIPRTLEGIFFVVYSFFYFHELLKADEIISLRKSAEFWAVIAFFTYFGTTQFEHLFSDYMRIKHEDLHRISREINRWMVQLYYLFLAYAFHLKGNNKN